MDSKKWYQSKEVWYNVIMTGIDFTAILMDAFGALVWLTLIHALGNIILRVWYTKVPIQ